MGELDNRRNVLLGVTGSIAAYKAVELTRQLITNNYEVKVILTESAKQFVGAPTFQALTGHPVATSFWEADDASQIEHIALADWADIMVIAPATADTIAKLAYGMADSPLLATALATRAPMLVAPAMNVNMLNNPRTQENLARLKVDGIEIVDPTEGELACGWNGAGRLAEIQEIVFEIGRILSRDQHDLAGKHIVVSTGPTREKIDPVRFISNRSSGKMGVAIAKEAYRRGATVTLVHGPIPVNVPSKIRTVAATSAEDMHDAMLKAVYGGERRADIAIMAAAVADYTPANPKDRKVKKSLNELSAIDLKINKDILLALGEERGQDVSPVLVGFAVETGEVEDLLNEVRRKLQVKKVDLIVGNLADDAFDSDTNRVWIVNRHGKADEVATSSKVRVANKVLDATLKL